MIDFSTIKDWQNYGLNRTLSGLKLANAQDIKAVELEEKYKKKGRDWNQILPILIIVLVVGAIAFQMINATLTNDQTAKKMGECVTQRAEARGNLNVCEKQLKALEGEEPRTIVPI